MIFRQREGHGSIGGMTMTRLSNKRRVVGKARKRCKILLLFRELCANHPSLARNGLFFMAAWLMATAGKRTHAWFTCIKQLESSVQATNASNTCTAYPMQAEPDPLFTRKVATTQQPTATEVGLFIIWGCPRMRLEDETSAFYIRSE